MFTKTRQTVTPEPEHEECLHHILTHSLFNTTEELMSEFSVIASPSGTRIIIWNLHRTLSNEKFELDFMKDPSDIQIPVDMYKSRRETNRRQTRERKSMPESEYSLRAYCSILYLKPRMQIILQGSKVETQFVTKTLANVLKDKYKPACCGLSQKAGVTITFGYNTKSKEHYGLMMYHKNRLIKAYERVACQRRANSTGEGVIGVIECNYLTPIHNKQDFEKNYEYRNTILSLGAKLENYWKEVHYRHKENCTESFDDTVKKPDQNWVQCDTCQKWRKLPDGIDPKRLPKKWNCLMNPDPQLRYCSVAEEPEDSDDEQHRYQKTYKKHERNQKVQQENWQQNPDHTSSILMSPTTSVTSAECEDISLIVTPNRKKKIIDLTQEIPEKKKAKIIFDKNIYDSSNLLSACEPDICSGDIKAECKGIKSLKDDDDDLNDKSTEKKEKSYQIKVLFQQVTEAIRNLQCKFIELKKELNKEDMDTMMDSLESEKSSLSNTYEILQKHCELLKTESKNVEESKEENTGPTTKVSSPGKDSKFHIQKDEEQHISESKRELGDIMQSLQKQEIRKRVSHLLVTYVPATDLELVTNDILALLKGESSPTEVVVLTKGAEFQDAHISSECEEKSFSTDTAPSQETQWTQTLPSSISSLSPGSDVLITEIVKHPADTGTIRFLCSYAGQFHCKLTNLVFEMKGTGEVLYRIMPWDNSVLPGLSQFQPAGPSYDIECHEDSIVHLHLPHCEITYDDKNQIDLLVAHFTEGNVEIMQPLKITNTHVIIEVQSLSMFTLVKKWLFCERPISGQILLFYKEMIGKQRKSKLNVHLLPGNVPFEEVRKQHQGSTYIECTSKCQLIPGKKYTPLCEPYICQPKVEKFDCSYNNPNYHPTFEVIFNTDVEDLTLGLLDEIGQQVWEPRQVFFAADGREAGPAEMYKDAEFVDRHRDMLIQRVSSVMEIADTLLTKNIIRYEAYNEIKVATTTQEKMRKLYECLDSEGRLTKVEFYKVLKEKHPLIVDDLESASSNA